MYGHSHRAGRGNASSPYSFQDTASSLTASGRTAHKMSLPDVYSSSSRVNFTPTARSMTTPSINPGAMPSSSYTSTAMPPTIKTMPNLIHGRLHRRGTSGSGSTTLEPGTPSNEREPFPELASPAPASPVSKVKPYLRKLSSAKEDQGRLDLSRPIADNDRLAGLGIQASKGVFVPPGRHTRTTSNGSQMSSHSTSSRPNQPFVHPMRQAPRPFTPTTRTHDFPYDDDDDDFLDDDHRPHHSFRDKRSMSSSSVPHAAPTPLSQTISIADLGAIPKLTSISQSNLSITSTKSSRAATSRRNTGRSEFATSPSSRTSFDKMSIIGGRRSDTDPRTRDERIREARRKFGEKEADKDRKAEKEAQKRREVEAAKEARRLERERSKSSASDMGRPQRPGTSGGLGAGRTSSALGKYSFNASEDRPSPPAPTTARFSEKQHTHAPAQRRPSTGFFSKLFSCGPGRRTP